MRLTRSTHDTAAAVEPWPIDPHVWKASAGKGVNIPDVGSMVYYFPQGHAEQASSPPDFSTVPRTKPRVLCRVASVRFLADQESDEVFARISLDPTLRTAPLTEPASVAGGGASVKASLKVLTQSDANNGGGFSVPKFCAVSIFPPLDHESDKPAQNLSMRDLVGNRWSFRHIYRGNPRRHLLTTGWSKFVDAKKLVGGDTVVFIRSIAGDGEVHVGIRRRDVTRGKVAAERVVEAVRAAEAGDRVFEVEYYPRRGAEFVVNEEAVAAAMKVPWAAGIKLRMSVRHVDDIRVFSHPGEVDAPVLADNGPWALSPWRMLKVKWENPNLVRDTRNVSPWQVEVVSRIPRTEPSSILSNRHLTVAQTTSNGTGNTMMGSLPPSLLSCSASPVGMQGARQDPDSSSNDNQPPRPEKTDGSPASTVSCESLLPPGEERDDHFCRPHKRTKCIQLFGWAIETEQPLETDAGALEQHEEAEASAQSNDPFAALPGPGGAATLTSPAS